jgi:2-polyprenyl-3-methyl-5-hydroxy-6-metoxy-1,4-benzoquinol methylase
MNCRHCSEPVSLIFSDLGTTAPSNSYLSKDDINKPEARYPLKVLVCENCWLTQTQDFASADDLFTSKYAYFSAFSSSWLSHCENFVTSVIKRFGLSEESLVVEVAANDGYLLQYVDKANIPCLGIEPTNATAEAAREKGIEVIGDFFGVGLAQTLLADNKQADLLIANNVLAHVPDINDFVSAFTTLLKPTGIATFEFPHLCELISNSQFDTIYHEHFSYLSFTSVCRVFAHNGLQVFDVEQLTTHGGSLRIYAQRIDSKVHQVEGSVSKLLMMESKLGVCTNEYYSNFETKTKAIKIEFVNFLNRACESGKSVAAYGAAAKGNTLMNYCGVDRSLIDYVVDKNPHKQGMYMPGSKIPIVDEDHLKQNKPDYIVIFPWNLVSEIVHQLDYARYWGAKFVVAIPTLKTL